MKLSNKALFAGEFPLQKSFVTAEKNCGLNQIFGQATLLDSLSIKHKIIGWTIAELGQAQLGYHHATDVRYHTQKALKGGFCALKVELYIIKLRLCKDSRSFKAYPKSAILPDQTGYLYSQIWLHECEDYMKKTVYRDPEKDHRKYGLKNKIYRKPKIAEPYGNRFRFSETRQQRRNRLIAESMR